MKVFNILVFVQSLQNLVVFLHVSTFQLRLAAFTHSVSIHQQQNFGREANESLIVNQA